MCSAPSSRNWRESEMDKDKLIRQLMSTFLEELDERVREVNQHVLALEKDPAGTEQAEHWKTLCRSVHSLKGAARSVNLPLIERACHRLEDILDAARDGLLLSQPELFSLLLAVADAIEEAGMRLREQQDLAGGPLDTLVSKLDSLAGSLTKRPPSRGSSGVAV